MALDEITVHQVAELERLRESMGARSALSLGDELLDWKNRQAKQDYPKDAALFVRSTISILTNELYTRALQDNELPGTPASALGFQASEISGYAVTYAYGRVDALSGQAISFEEAFTFAQYCVDEDVSHGKLCDAFNAMFPKWASKR